jgi:hypothetical protein
MMDIKEIIEMAIEADLLHIPKGHEDLPLQNPTFNTMLKLQKFAELTLKRASLSVNEQDVELKPDWFSTEDEHFASSLDELAEQFLNSYEAGDVITVNLTKDLGVKDYKYYFDASGKPFLEAIANKKGGM